MLIFYFIKRMRSKYYSFLFPVMSCLFSVYLIIFHPPTYLNFILFSQMCTYHLYSHLYLSNVNKQFYFDWFLSICCWTTTVPFLSVKSKVHVIVDVSEFTISQHDVNYLLLVVCMAGGGYFFFKHHFFNIFYKLCESMNY